jgi:acyl carrier protein
LQQRLPEYVVPSTYIMLDALPLTPNGKVDRRALPAPEWSKRELGEAYVAPRTPIEEVLADIWSQVLGVERVGIHDSFFDLGGHSLLATQVIARARDAFQVALPVRMLFETPTIAGLALATEKAMADDVKSPAPAITSAPRRWHRVNRTPSGMQSILDDTNNGGA